MSITTASEVGDLVAELVTPAGQADPYPVYRELRALGPAVASPDGAVVVTGYRECAALLRSPDVRKNPGPLLTASGYPDWCERPSLRMMFGSLLMLNPPSHTRLRRLVASAFSVRHVAGLRSSIERIVASAIDRMDGVVDFVETFAFPVPVAVIGELLGVPPADRAMFRGLVRDWTQVLELLHVDAVDQADLAAGKIAAYLGALAEERRARPAGDLISALVAAEDDGEHLTDDELVTTAALLLGAGFETTTGLLANGLVALLACPDEAAELRSSPELASGAAEELLRFDTPLQILFGRTAAVDLSVGGVEVAEGTRLLTVVGAANRDPAAFDDPDRLDLDRGGEPSLSFGGGIHHCLGAPLAKLEAEIAFPALLRRFPHLQLAGDGVHREGITLHGYTALPVNAG